MNSALNQNPVTGETLAIALKAVADPLRLAILRLMAQDSFGVLELAGLFDMPQSGMSHHLKVLTKGGWIASRREGNSNFYRRQLVASHWPLANTRTALLADLDQQPLAPALVDGLQQLYAERSKTSQAFFAENAQKFHAQQDLIASFPVYGDSVCEMLGHLFPATARHAIEVGPGAGELLPWLSQRFERVTALDNAPEMLAQARDNNRTLHNVTFIEGDTRTGVNQGFKADCVVTNMVLHHTPSPAEVFSDLASMLEPGGQLVVTDLCRHDQSWARDACGDLWQGFEPEEFSGWAQRAGLIEGQSNYFALRNGFQIQLRQFRLANSIQ
ncbi:ArsR/SmtB family transcription factor [Simiduia agarivorans]|uniref:ArsR family transcriptional regulator n=1 Tax=Simiduia agarivorans (strain DSM 21679 / JCM 13881 / BCRC 17597 / SA1) TaxID=1117647 RepID=K4KL44_SIMAS|nr:metalloregulator ArsR/SmtB family transcription factor [Simiduia agarivorans]AFU99879.1 ArsR family transcriptional regulator [Simiduia agarivorans SA1 = DSM 21679]